MKDIKQKFYEKVYPKNGKKLNLRSSIGWLYLLLRSFETYRENVVYDLLPSGDKFLDIGCGEGNLVLKALNKFKIVYGIDITRTRLNETKNRINKLKEEKKSRIKFLVADADDKLPFENNYFSAITMVATLEHFFDPYHVLGEAYRILKPKGSLVVQVPNLVFLPRRIAFLMGYLPVTSEDESGWDGGHLHYFTVSSLKKLLEEKNFSIEKITCSGVFAPLRRWWVSLSGADIIISSRKIAL